MASRSRKHYSPEHKLKIVKEGLLNNVKISELCRFYDIYPADYYRWKKLTESAMIDGLKSNKTKKKKLSKREEELIKENERLKNVIIQFTKEHVDLKKKSTAQIKSKIFQKRERRSLGICRTYVPVNFI